MIKLLSFNDWLEKWVDELPEDADLYTLYDEYKESVEEMNLEHALSHV